MINYDEYKRAKTKQKNKKGKQMSKTETEPKFIVSDDEKLMIVDTLNNPLATLNNLDKTINKLTKLKAERDTEVSLTFDFTGLVLASYIAIDEAIKDIFGRAEAMKEGFWGEIPPKRLSIKTGPNSATQVFVGRLAPPAWKGGWIHMQPNPRDYMSLLVSAKIKRKYEHSVKKLIDLAKEKARHSSMYHGQAWDLDLDVLGAIQAGVPWDPVVSAPKAIEDLDKTPVLVLPRDIENRLIVHLWNIIERPDDYRYNSVQIRNGIVLLGPSGTGKTLTIMHTIKKAIQRGFTVFKLLTPQWFVEAYKIAQFHSPALLITEDVEKFLGGPKTPSLDRHLEVLDGSSTKNSEVVVLGTTNHPEQISEWVRRDGRMGTSIEYRTLDAEAGGRLIQVLASEYLAEDVDLEKVGVEIDTFPASAVAGALDYAKQLAIHQFGREIKGKLTTETLIDAIELTKQDKGLYRPATISQDTSNIAIVRMAEAIKHGVDIPPEVWHVASEFFKGSNSRKEKSAKGKVLTDAT